MCVCQQHKEDCITLNHRKSNHHAVHTKLRISRKVHPSCRLLRFWLWMNLRCSFSRPSRVRGKISSADKMRNYFESRQIKARKLAIDALRYLKLSKEVIKNDCNTGKDLSRLRKEESSEKRERQLVGDSRRDHRNILVENSERFYRESAERNSRILGFQGTDSSNMNSDFNNVRDTVDASSNGNIDIPRVHSRIKFRSCLYEKRDLISTRISCPVESIEFSLKKCQLMLPHSRSEEGAIGEPFAPLTKGEEAEVAYAFSEHSSYEFIHTSSAIGLCITHETSGIEITGKVIQCLRPRAWLNDQVVDLYLELLKERQNRDPEKFLKCHFFGTFFYKALIARSCGYDYNSVRKWTSPQRLGYYLLECDKIFVPVHKEDHWSLAIINRKHAKVQYLDSLGGRDSEVMNILARYFVDEVKDKSGLAIDISSWEHEFVEDHPLQRNRFDCGMFMIKYIDFYARDMGLCFSQKDVPYFRRRTAKEILKLKAQ